MRIGKTEHFILFCENRKFWHHCKIDNFGSRISLVKHNASMETPYSWKLKRLFLITASPEDIVGHIYHSPSRLFWNNQAHKGHTIDSELAYIFDHRQEVISTERTYISIHYRDWDLQLWVDQLRWWGSFEGTYNPFRLSSASNNLD